MKVNPSGAEIVRWEGESVDALRAAWGLPRLEVRRSVSSTNDVARAMADAGAPAGSCVIAEEQVAGRGRERRTWSSPPGLGIWMSLVLRPEQRSDPGVLPLLVGVAVAGALEPYCRPFAPSVKWPNDILLEERKLGGILCEAVWAGMSQGYVIAGIGINVLHLEEDFPHELRGTATSLRRVCRWSPSRAEVAGAVARAVVAISSPPVLTAARLAELRRRDALFGKRIIVSDAAGGAFTGTADGIEADGTLRVLTPAAELRRIRTGTVRAILPDDE
jgi:BirA family transcriptional regulator, biotin operon repressor / biotin---[acetyl-CoA-carboxylase] ligase